MNKSAIIKNAQAMGGDVGVRYKGENGVMVLWFDDVESAVARMEKWDNDYPELVELSLISWSGEVIYKVK